MKSTLMVTIPGFWGLQSDFTELKAEIRRLQTATTTDIDFWGPEIFTPTAEFPPETFAEWTKRLLIKIQKIRANRKVIVLGYSLGARLALHLISLNSDLNFWAQCFLLSGHPGLTHRKDLDRRHKFDQHWSKRFLFDPWTDLLDSWNSLDIFKNDLYASREESNFSRSFLSRAFDVFSPTQHTCKLTSFEAGCARRIGIVGELDTKYRAIYSALLQDGFLNQLLIVSNHGHRVITCNNLARLIVENCTSCS